MTDKEKIDYKIRLHIFLKEKKIRDEEQDNWAKAIWFSVILLWIVVLIGKWIAE